MTKKNGIRIISLLAVILLLAGISAGASACEPEGGVTIYKVAEPERIEGHGDAFYYKLCGEFEGCGINISYLTAEKLAEHLAVYAGEHEILGGGETSGPGLYLAAIGKSAPYLIAVDEYGMHYDIAAPPGDKGGETTLAVQAVWNTVSPPESVTAVLLCDGEVMDTAVLCGENGWSHTWHDLDEGRSYTAVETGVPEGCFASYKTEGSVVTIKNTENTAIRRNCPTREGTG